MEEPLESNEQYLEFTLLLKSFTNKNKYLGPVISTIPSDIYPFGKLVSAAVGSVHILPLTANKLSPHPVYFLHGQVLSVFVEKS